MSLLSKFFGDPNQKYIKSLDPLLEQINKLGAEYRNMSDGDMAELALKWRQQLKQGKKLDDLLAQVFAAVRQAAARHMETKGHFDVQLIGAYAMHQGKIAEMKTGEGKTSYAVSPAAALNALSGCGVHVITVNDYLSKRDAGWIGGVYHRLGLSVGVIVHQAAFMYDPLYKSEDDFEDSSEIQMPNLRPVNRKQAYECDITYGTNNEFGFDYLRDNMAQSLEQKVQRELNYAIIDEVDSILIDEARTPLIISGPAEQAADKYRKFASLVTKLKLGDDYNVDEKMRAATLTEDGIKKMEQWLGMENIYTEGGISEVHHIEAALKAQVIFERDKDYVVKDGEIIIVDEFTGRLMYGRRYSEGLHQAIEAKEGVEIKQESVTMATITFQNYFRMYKKLAGMTGTAATEAEEFSKIYDLEVVVVPTNKPTIRIDQPDLIYKNETAKFNAVIEDVKQRNKAGQPVLIGTISIEKNEQLSFLLEKAGVKHNILNAKNHAREAEFIAEAGSKGAVTLATNMAGRGVDIVLGGEGATKNQSQEIKDLGGLYVIGTERHESRRIDNQLRGRSGRQGDPGESRFYVSLEDDLMRIFGSERIGAIMNTLGIPDDQPIEHKMISKSLEAAQKKVEGRNFDIRKHLVEYDDVINKHREVVYRKRNRILKIYHSLRQGDKIQDTVDANSKEKSSKTQKNFNNQILASKQDINDKPQISNNREYNDLKDMVLEMVENEIEQVVSFHTQSEDESSWNIDEVYEVVDTIFPLPVEVRLKMDDIQKTAGDNQADMRARNKLIDYLVGLAKEDYDKLERNINDIAKSDNSQLEARVMPIRQAEKAILLRSIDMLWVEHIDAMDHLRRGIGLRGYGQKDPLVEYKREAYQMFVALQNNIQKQVVYSIFKIEAAPGGTKAGNSNLVYKGANKTAGFSSYASRADNTNMSMPATIGAVSSSVVKPAPIEHKKKIGRNDPCPCGSGKKYKKCCGA